MIDQTSRVEFGSGECRESVSARMIMAAALQFFFGRRPTFRYCHELQDWVFVK